MLSKSLVRLVFAISLGISGAALAQGSAPQTTARPAPAKPAAVPAATPAKPTLLDLNSANRDDLKALKGVGDKRADDIIKGRPYKGKDELVQKKIIPKGVYDAIKDQIIAKQK